MPTVAFRFAQDTRDLEQLHALHYKAFVEEIPQHATNSEGRHVDRFHDQNVYAVAVEGDQVVGSVALRAQRPYSLDHKLEDLDSYLPAGLRFCEVRLLNIARERRGSQVLPGLVSMVYEYARREGLDGALISATTRQLKLYGHLGFVPFGPLVGTADAAFQPMYLTVDRFEEHARAIAALPPVTRGAPASVHTGPVSMRAEVIAAFETPAIAHRSVDFDAVFHETRDLLTRLAGRRHADILLGTGTLANDCVAAQLATLRGPGLILSNGEFGERLVDHATRAGLQFDHASFAWGAAFDLDQVRARLAEEKAEWVWMVACETSTGTMNDVQAVSNFCKSSGAKLALDAISALGAVPLDLSGVWLTSATSGKALGSYPGLSMVFHDHSILPDQRIPRYLDLGLYGGEHVPFTHSSNLVRALHAAISNVDWMQRFAEIRATGVWLRERLRRVGLKLVENGGELAPHVLTIELPGSLPSVSVAETLARLGFLVGYASDYLRSRNWIQVCLMGEFQRDTLVSLVRALASLIPPAAEPKDARTP